MNWYKNFFFYLGGKLGFRELIWGGDYRGRLYNFIVIKMILVISKYLFSV